MAGLVDRKIPSVADNIQAKERSWRSFVLDLKVFIKLGDLQQYILFRKAHRCQHFPLSVRYVRPNIDE